MPADNETDAPRVLVVDDQPEALRLLRLLLGSNGFQVTTAGGGQEALDLAREGHFDIVLLDLMMPEMDGMQVCSRLKGSPATAAIPVVFVTAKDDPGTRAECAAVGGADFVAKPVRTKALVELIRRNLGRI